MKNKLYTYIVALLVGTCCSLGAHAQTDSSVVEDEDSTAVDTTAESNGNYNKENSGATKFAVMDSAFSVEERKLPSSTQQDLKKNKDYWYADKPANEEEKRAKPEEYHERKSVWDFLNSSAMYAIFWAVVVGVFLLILFLYLRTFTSSAKKIRRTTAVETVVEEENIFALNFDEAINKALADSNYRVATRLLFLRLLRNMSEKRIINYGQDKTNMDYLFELANTKYAKEFMQATRTYEYVWYGGFVPHQQQFTGIRNIIDGLNQKIN